MAPLMSARSLYPPIQSSQRTAALAGGGNGTFENADDPPPGYLVRKCTCIPCEPVIKFHWDRASVSRHRLVLVFTSIEPTAAGLTASVGGLR